MTFPIHALATLPPDLAADLRAAGTIEGDLLTIPDAQLGQIMHEHLAYMAATPLGLGDRLHRLLQPIARLTDRLLRTHLSACPACQQRRTWLNRLGQGLRATLFPRS